MVDASGVSAGQIRLATDGGGGSDALAGGLGDDVLFGGGGMDGYLFNTALNVANNIDSVADDTIRLDNVIFTTLADGALGAPAFSSELPRMTRTIASSPTARPARRPSTPTATREGLRSSSSPPCRRA